MPAPRARTGTIVGGRRRRWIVLAGALSLLAILEAELVLSATRQSQIGDEGCHIYAGYRYWTHGDFGLNPEHPPLVKLMAALPLLVLDLKAPPLPETSSKADCFFGAAQFLYTNDADRILLLTRTAASVFTLLLAIVVFLAAAELFGIGAAFLALGLLVFEPNVLAHGALVTTDMGATFGLFAGVYAFYRFSKKRSLLRLLVCGLVVGVALCTKHSSVFVVPILVLLAALEIAI